MKSSLFTSAGYILFLLGFLSILLSMVGLQLTPLRWLTSMGMPWSLIVKILMLFGGLIIMYISKMPAEE